MEIVPPTHLVLFESTWVSIMFFCQWYICSRDFTAGRPLSKLTRAPTIFCTALCHHRLPPPPPPARAEHKWRIVTLQEIIEEIISEEPEQRPSARQVVGRLEAILQGMPTML